MYEITELKTADISVSIPKRVSEALKPIVGASSAMGIAFQSLKGFQRL